MTEAGERVVPKVPVMKKHSGAELQDIAKRASKAIPGAARLVNQQVQTHTHTHIQVHCSAAVLQGTTAPGIVAQDVNRDAFVQRHIQLVSRLLVAAS